METLGRYEYTNEEYLDPLFKCSLCANTLMHPVSTKCTPKKHTFCTQCIQKYIQDKSGCPTCQEKVLKEDLTPNNDEFLNDMLDKLSIKCSHCKQTGLKRIDFSKHYRDICSEAIIRCLAADIKCQWTGPRGKLDKHLKKCQYHHLRDLITEILDNNKELKQQVNQQSNEIQKLNSTLMEQQKQNQELEKRLELFQIQMAQFIHHIAPRITGIDQQKNPDETIDNNNQHAVQNNQTLNPIAIKLQSTNAAADRKMPYGLVQKITDFKKPQNNNDQHVPRHEQEQQASNVLAEFIFNVVHEILHHIPIIEPPTDESSRQEPVVDQNTGSSPASNVNNRPLVAPRILPNSSAHHAPPLVNLNLQHISSCGNVNVNIGETANVGGNTTCHAKVGNRYVDTNANRPCKQSVDRNNLTHRGTHICNPNNNDNGDNYNDLESASNLGSDGNTVSVHSANDAFDRSSINNHIQHHPS